MNIEKIIKIIRELKENAVVGGMTTGSSGPIAGYSEKSLPEGPNAGWTPPFTKMQKRPPIIARGRMPGARTRWKPSQP